IPIPGIPQPTRPLSQLAGQRSTATSPLPTRPVAQSTGQFPIPDLRQSTGQFRQLSNQKPGTQRSTTGQMPVLILTGPQRAPDTDQLLALGTKTPTTTNQLSLTAALQNTINPVAARCTT